MIAPTLVRQLKKALPPAAVVTDALELALYGYDGTAYQGTPDCVVHPETTEQVVAVVRACHEADVPIVPRGAATSLSGGAVPTHGGVVIALGRMDRILDLDFASHRAIVQPGVVNTELQNALAGRRFLYAPDPSSQIVCTLGGNIAENSGGPHCLKYGVTVNHITGLEMVLPDGDLLRVGGKALDGPGYDLLGVIIGSEGTFGVVTEITCRIIPMPETVVTMLAIFDSLEQASEAVSAIIADGLIPATLEMMDNTMIRAVEKGLHAGYPLDAEAVLIIELDGLRDSMRHQVERVEAACQRHGVTRFQVAHDENERTLLWRGRKGAFGAVANISPSKLCTDIAVPRTELPKVLAEVMEIGRRWDIPIGNVFHAGDGNLHPQVLYDPRDPEQVRRVTHIDAEITECALAHGGVLTGEHGIGCAKRRHMAEMFGPAELRAMWRVKDAFDPAGLCNPGKVLPDRETIPAPEPLTLPQGPFSSAGPAVAIRGESRWLEPRDEEAVQKALAVASREGHPVALRGGGTKSGPSPEGAEVISLARLGRVINYDYQNLTLTAQCGVRLAELEKLCAAREQMLPLRPRFADRCTLGGVVACNEYGPHRLAYGTARDMVTGLRAVLGDGSAVRFGSSCVKNVSGYALERLLVGSRGSFGAITEITVRLLPRPEERRTLMLRVADAITAREAIAQLLAGPAWPAALELLNPAACRAFGWGDEGWLLVAALEGFTADVEQLTVALGNLAREHGLGVWEQPPGPYDALWMALTDLDPRGLGTPMLAVSCPLSETLALARELNALDDRVGLRAGAGLGLIHCAVASKLGLRAYQAQAEALAAEHGAGTARWLAPTPAGLESGATGAASELCRRLKTAFDPRGILPVR